MNKVFLRTQYNYDMNVAGDESGVGGGESMTKQEFKEECDINTIVRRFGLTGELPTGVQAPTYGDFEFVGDYKSAVEMVMASEDAFMKFPAEVRARFENDPQQLLEFCADSNNRAEAERLGLVFGSQSESKVVAKSVDSGKIESGSNSATNKETQSGKAEK